MKKLLDKVGRKRPGGPSLVGKQIVIGSTCVRVESLLGEGGFGSIYRVREIYSGQLYAVKHLRLQGDPEAIQSVQQEARIMFKLKEHKHVLRLHAVAFGGEKGAETDGYMLLDYCPNTLISMLESYNFMLENPLIMDIFISVCEGVAHMHSLPQPLAHRDLKVENVLRLTDGTWVICDFGSATTRAQVYQSQAEIAAEEEVIRRTTTPAYRAPEMVDMLNRQRIDTKVDIWALGVMLYVLCFGKLPFQGDSKLQILYGRYDIPPGRPGVFRELIQDMLIVRPDDRPDIHTVLTKAKHYASSLVPPGPLVQPGPLIQHQPMPAQHVMRIPSQTQQRQQELLVVPSQHPPPDFQVSAPIIHQPRHAHAASPTQAAHMTQYSPNNMSPRGNAPGAVFGASAAPATHMPQYTPNNISPHSNAATVFNTSGGPVGMQHHQAAVSQPAVQHTLQQAAQQAVQPVVQQQPRYQTLSSPAAHRPAPTNTKPQSPSRETTGERMLSERMTSDRSQSYQPATRDVVSQESLSQHNLHTELPSSNGNVPTSTLDKYSVPLTHTPKHTMVATSSSSDNSDSDDANAQDMRTDRAIYRGREGSTAGTKTAEAACDEDASAGVGYAAGGGMDAAQWRHTGGMATSKSSTRQQTNGEEWTEFSNMAGGTSPLPGRPEVASRLYPDRAIGTAADVSPLTAAAQESVRPASRSPSPPPQTTGSANISDSIAALRDSVAGDIDAIRRQLKEVVVSNQSLTSRVKALEDTTTQQRHIIQRLQSELDAARGVGNSTPNGNSTSTNTMQPERQISGHSHSRYSSFNEYGGGGQGGAVGGHRGGTQVAQEARGGSFWGQGQNGAP